MKQLPYRTSHLVAWLSALCLTAIICTCARQADTTDSYNIETIPESNLPLPTSQTPDGAINDMQLPADNPGNGILVYPFSDDSIIQTISANQPSQLLRLLDAYPDGLQLAPEAVLLALGPGRVELLQILLDHGLDPSTMLRTRHGGDMGSYAAWDSLLSLSIKNEAFDCALLLLEQGANVHALSGWDESMISPPGIKPVMNYFGEGLSGEILTVYDRLVELGARSLATIRTDPLSNLAVIAAMDLPEISMSNDITLHSLDDTETRLATERERFIWLGNDGIPTPGNIWVIDSSNKVWRTECEDCYWNTSIPIPNEQPPIILNSEQP